MDGATLSPPDIAAYTSVQVWLEGVLQVCDYFHGTVYVRGNCDQDPFSLAGLLRGMADWLVDIMDPDMESDAFAVLDYCTQATSQFLRLMQQTGCSHAVQRR